MAVKRGANVGDHKVLYVVSDGAEEMAALEKLGPATRYAIMNSPVNVSAVSVVQDVAEYAQRLQMELDPADPVLDKRLAHGIVMGGVHTLLKDRSEQDAWLGVTPIEGKPSPRSVREQRKAMRGSRRWR